MDLQIWLAAPEILQVVTAARRAFQEHGSAHAA
jgi:hypothetical protein